MDTLLKWIMAIVGGLLSLFAPVTPLVLCALTFVMIDFVMGILAGRKRAARQHKDWYFSSDKAWKTVIKLTCIVVGIGMCHLIDTQIIDFMNLHLAKLFTGMVCGIEMWSYLENAMEISDAPVFRSLQKYVGKKMKDEVGIDIENAPQAPADGAVTEAKLAPSSVATEKLQDLCVTTPKIADQAVDTTKLNTGGSPGGSVE
jgi:phage-related holin